MTLHATAKIAPCELLFNRTVKGYLPELLSKKIFNRHKEAKENIEKSKERNNENYDKRHHAKESNIKEGDIVICLQKKRNKLTPKFSPERFTVVSRKGTRLVAKNTYHIIERNVSNFKKVSRYETTEEEDDYTDGEAKDTNSNIERDLQIVKRTNKLDFDVHKDQEYQFEDMELCYHPI